MSLADQSQQWYPTSVQVTVLQARNLRIKGKNGTNDAYAIMQVAKEKFATSVVEKTVSPMWKEEATFDLQLFHHGNTERCTLHVNVMHRALVGPDKLLGQAVVNLLELSAIQSRSKTEWFQLLDKAGKSDKDRGEVLVDIQFMRNNMTASMFDLSASDKPRSRLGKLKDKVRGKKKDGLSDTASAVVPSFTQVLTDSEGEGEPEGDGAADKDGKKKKKVKKLKSLFSPKSNLQRNVSQSMSVLGPLPERNSSLTGSRSSGLNMDSSEGKTKFKFLTHKRTGSSDSKGSQGSTSILGRSRQASTSSADQSNLCINGSHVYTEEPQPRSSRPGSTFSLASSGLGSMEDLRRSQGRKSSVASVDSLKAGKQPFPWEEESLGDREEQEEDGVELERERMRVEQLLRRKLLDEEQRATEEEKKRVREQEEEDRMRRLEEEESIRRTEQERRRLEEEGKMKEERERGEKKERIRREEEDKIRIAEQERERVKEENTRIEEEERIMKEQDQRKVMEDAEKIRLEEEERAAEERKKTFVEEEVRRVRQEREEEKIREQERLFEEERRKEEDLLRREEEARMEQADRLRGEMEKRKRDEEQIIRREEEEKSRQEEEEFALRRAEEERQRMDVEENMRREERRRNEEEETLQEERKMRDVEDKRREEEERRQTEEERRRKEEEDRVREEEESRLGREEEERKIREMEDKRREEDERRKTEERRRKEEEDRLKREEEHRLQVEEEERERLDMEEKRRRKEEEERRRLEEEERVRKEVEEFRLKEEEERKIRDMEEKRRREENEWRKTEEERRRKEEEDRLRVEEDERKTREQQRLEREMEEKRKEERESVIRLEEERLKEEERRKSEEESRKSEEESRKSEEESRKSEEESRKSEEESRKSEEESRKEQEEKRRAEDQKMKVMEERERARLEEDGRKEANLEKERRMREEEEEGERQEQEKTRLAVAEKQMVLQDGEGEALVGKNPFEEVPSEDPFEDISSLNPFVEPSNTHSTEPLNRTTKVSAVKPSSTSCLTPPKPLVSSNPFFTPSEVEGPTTPPIGHQGVKTSPDSSASLMEKKRQAPLPPDSLRMPHSSDVATARQPHAETTKPTLTSHSAMKLVGKTDARRSADGVCLDPCSALQDKRPAPQPPDSLGGTPGAQSPMQKDLRSTVEMLGTNQRPGEERDASDSGASSLCAVEMIAPLKASTTAMREESRELQGQGFPHHRNQFIDVSAIPLATGGFRVAKKGPAPSRPDSSCQSEKTVTEYDESPANVQKHSSMEPSMENYPSNGSPVVFEINSIAESGRETQSHQLRDNGESLRSHNKSSQSINEEVALPKSLKVVRAPMPPSKMIAISTVTLETPQNSGTPASGTAVNEPTNNTDVEQPVNIITQTQCFSHSEILEGSLSKPPEASQATYVQGTCPPQARSQPCEAMSLESHFQGGEEVAGKPASASRRPHPVKPLNSSEQQPVSTIQGGHPEKSEAISGSVQEKIKVQKPGVKGPYSQLTQEELISLVVKQQKQLGDRDKKIKELEQYIDNLLVRVIEEAPCILMSLNSPKP